MIKAIKADIYFRKAQKRADNGNFEDSISYYDKAISVLKRPIGILEHKALVLSNLNMYEESVHLLKKAIKLRPQNHCGYLFLGIVNYDNHKFEDAIGCFSKALEVSPNNKIAICYKYLSQLSLNGMDPEILDKIGKYIDFTKADLKARFLIFCETYLINQRGSKSFEQNQFYDAYLRPENQKPKTTFWKLITTIENTLTKMTYIFKPEQRKLFNQFVLAKEHLEKGHIDESQKAFQLVLESNPNLEDVLNYFLDICIYKNEFDLALKYLKKNDSYKEALEISGSEKINSESININLSIRLFLGIFFTNIGEYEKAIQLLKISIDDNTRNFYPFYCLGLCYLHTNNKNEALKSFTNSMSRLNPGFIKNRIDECKRVFKTVLYI